MTFFLQLTVTGLLTGSLYALIALGIVLIYKATRVFNFAQGEVLIISGLMTTTFISMFGIALGLIFGIIIAFFMGLVVERLTLRPLIGQPILSTIMMTLGLAWVLRGFGSIGWQSTIRHLPEFIPAGQFKLGEVGISQTHLAAFIVSMLAFILFAIFFKKTKLGLGMRATAENHQYGHLLYDGRFSSHFARCDWRWDQPYGFYYWIEGFSSRHRGRIGVFARSHHRRAIDWVNRSMGRGINSSFFDRYHPLSHFALCFIYQTLWYFRINSNRKGINDETFRNL
jgi:ABC-type amino acid transport system permease subunit